MLVGSLGVAGRKRRGEVAALGAYGRAMMSGCRELAPGVGCQVVHPYEINVPCPFVGCTVKGAMEGRADLGAILRDVDDGGVLGKIHPRLVGN